MPGGHFEYRCFQISQFAEEPKHAIQINTVKNEYGYAANFQTHTTQVLDRCRQVIEIAGALAKEIEWLYSGDHDEESCLKAIAEILVPVPHKDINVALYRQIQQCAAVSQAIKV